MYNVTQVMIFTPPCNTLTLSLLVERDALYGLSLVHCLSVKDDAFGMHSKLGPSAFLA